MSMPVDYRPFHLKRKPVFADEAGTRCEFYVSKSAVNRIRRTEPRWKYNCLRLVPKGMRRPTAVLRGLRRKEFEDGYCYCSRLEMRYDNVNQLIPAPEDQLFLVFVMKIQGLVVFDWEFREEDELQPGYPKNWREDFEGEIELWETDE